MNTRNSERPLKRYQHVFGPVPSRRFGRSLGIDLLPSKICSFNCIFCQIGRTTVHTLKRREYVPLTDVLNELQDWLRHDGQADYITLSGSGEPTLHSRFGEVLGFVRDNTAIPAVLLTNGTLLRMENVRNDACMASVVKIPLSAWDERSFLAINRPCSGIRLADILQSYRLFRNVFKGQIWLEVFLINGRNDAPSQVQDLAELAATFSPDRIHLNTAVRPPAESSATPVPQARMQTLVELFHPVAEVISEFSTRHNGPGQMEGQMILDMLRRHPATEKDMAAAFHAREEDIAGILQDLVSLGLVREERHAGTTHYVAKPAS